MLAVGGAAGWGDGGVEGRDVFGGLGGTARASRSAFPGTASAPTVVRAQNAGGAVINGLWIRRSTRRTRTSASRGVGRGGVQLAQHTAGDAEERVSMARSTWAQNDHDQGNTDNPIEDVWVGVGPADHRDQLPRGSQRVAARGGDAAMDADLGGSQARGNPNVGITIRLGGCELPERDGDRSGAGGFRTRHTRTLPARSTRRAVPVGPQRVAGIVSINAPDQSLYCEPDNVILGRPRRRSAMRCCGMAAG